ncbi:entry exclusion protein TrbK (plasmid) [Sinorhizobium numidicum]|uniref:Entry exclusion protein TrbK n=2 Tax=Sinorhizobium TaxID=28105 RepID=A0ABY8DKG3_9HYPH|nr:MULTISPECIES: entry exclusion protein TrbK [Sinorhizobium]WEX79493.1 entry exclusion protein TrbK [Sinorhizobium numidicum]WEX85553.1 entry exclusion protein TrbK [Sinorhizobium numidicum]WEX91401.1 entry exclusion protein TrbK [Sinorhizobium garamanticum]
MSRAVVIALLVLVAAVSSAATVLIVNSRDTNQPALTEGATREKLFGSGKELPPIKDGQEMRPRW